MFLWRRPFACGGRRVRFAAFTAALAGLWLLKVSNSGALSLIIFIMTNLFALWCWMPTATWPKWLTSTTFAIYVSHQWLQGIVKFIPLGPFAYRNMSNNAVLWLFWVVVSFAIPMCAAILFGKFFPRIAEIIYGGRTYKLAYGV